MKFKIEFFAFCLVGVIGFGFDVGVLYGLAPYFGWYGARGVSFLSAATVTWALNRRYTFRSRIAAQSMWAEYVTYLITMLGGAAVNYGTYALVLNFLHIAGSAAIGVAFGSGAGLAVNFAAANYLVFKRP